MDERWWQTFFDETYTRTWAQAGFFADTEAQVEGILSVLPDRSALRILDVPCGFGRHSAGLHARGHVVTGVDLSADQLDIARARHPGPRYVQADMRTPPAGPFDVVLNLFSSIGYFGDAEEDLVALRAWHDVLAPGGLLVVETNHRDRVARHLPTDEQVPLGESDAVETPEVDWVTGIVHSTVVLPDGRRRHFKVRLYTATDLASMAGEAGFIDVEVTGDWEGTPITPDTRLVLRARRPRAS